MRMTRAVALLATSTLAMAACTPTFDQTGEQIAVQETPGSQTEQVAPSAAPNEPAPSEIAADTSTTEADNTDAGAGQSAQERTGATGATTASGSGTGTTTTTVDSGESTDGGGNNDGGDTQAEGPTPPEANLYNDQDKYVGITDDTIELCGHAALIFAEAFNTRPEDLNVYWEAVNRNGGIYGRSVEMDWNDDAYSPDQAVTAANQCASEDPFFLIGGIEFDQIPAVRNWAEENRMLYLHHIAIGPDKPFNYSFSYQPTVEAVGRAFGEHIAANHGDRSVGIVWRQSENWEPGHKLGRATMDQYGVEILRDLPVSKSQSVYTQEILELQGAGVEVVWLWENALGAAQFIQQSYDQGYTPKFVVFPFQTTLDVLGENRSLNPSIEGVSTWPSYAPGGYGGAWTEQGLEEEIARFEAAYAKYRPDTEPNDILFQVWIGNKALHKLFEQCGPDCNRNRIAGLWLSGLKDSIQPNCTFDFGRKGSFGNHVGGYQFYAQETIKHSSGPVWSTTRWCTPSLIN